MMGAGALAAATVIGAGLVDYPTAVAEQPAAAAVQTREVKAQRVKREAKAKRVKREVRYVRLKPGQKAPKGAKVIREAAPKPRVVVRQVVVRGPSRSTRSVARSRQSGG